MLLSPCLMHNHNLFNCRLILLGGRLLWSLQTFCSVRKTTPEQDLQYRLSLAAGRGEHLLHEIWRTATSDPLELARLGWQVAPNRTYCDLRDNAPAGLGGSAWPEGPGVDPATIPTRLVDFLLHVLEARLWTNAVSQYSLPEAFVGMLTDRREPWTFLQDLWNAAVDAEAWRAEFPTLFSLRAQVYWLDWPLVQWLLRLGSQFGFQPHDFICAVTRILFTRIGDSKGVEETVKKLRALEQRDQDPDTVSLTRMYHQCTLSEHLPLHARHIPYVTATEESAYTVLPDPPVSGAAKHDEPWGHIFGRHHRAPRPKGWTYCRMMAKHGQMISKQKPQGVEHLSAQLKH